MNINLCDINIDALNCSRHYLLFDCSFLKADTKHSRVFVESRGTKFYRRKISVSRSPSMKLAFFRDFFSPPSTARFTVWFMYSVVESICYYFPWRSAICLQTFSIYCDYQQLIWYDMIYLSATGLTNGGSSTVHIYTQAISRTTQNKQYI
jgi:hypothetical protein